MSDDPRLAECLGQQEAVKSIFATCHGLEERYHKLIELGRALPPLPTSYHQPLNEVSGCQSRMYLHAELKDNRIYFQAYSEALISLGLAAVLIQAYNGLSPELVLTCPPTYLEDLQLQASLSPNRANGLYSIHLKMKQHALRLLTQP